MAKKYILIALLYGAGVFQSQAGIPLVVNGKSIYTICVLDFGSAHTMHYADSLQFYIHTIAGCILPVASKVNDHSIVLELKQGAVQDDESFYIYTNKQNIFLAATTEKGIEHAVYYFLQKYLGCRYYANDCKLIPSAPTITLPDIDDRQVPSFAFRMTSYGEATKAAYIHWNMLDNYTIEDPALKNTHTDWGLWVHTLHKLLPPEKYFKTHPEYYALRNNIRVPDELCLSNPEVLKIVIASLKDEIAKNPTAKYWSVSQLDNYNYCQCDKCRKVDSIEQSQSGSVIRFVNQVAAAFPDKIISTLAYQYSRKPPALVKPLPNVNIMLCTIECDRSKSIAADTTPGSFYDDLKGWSALTHNIIVWDYVINFSNIVMPFPNIKVLQPNIRLFRKFGASMIFEQAWRAKGGEFESLRSYLLSKLMWDENADVDALTKDFAQHYYGNAAGYICEYIHLQEQLLSKQKPLTIYEWPYEHATDYLSPEAIEQYLSLLQKAEDAVKDDTLALRHVREAKQPVLYAYIEVSKAAVHQPYWCFEQGADGNYHVKEKAEKILDDFYKGTQQFGPYMLNEHGNEPELYYKNMKAFYAAGVLHDKAYNKPIAFAIPFDKQYPANGYSSLVDGILGTDDYHILWQGWEGSDLIATVDLQEPTPIKKIALQCLDVGHSWILFPVKVSFEVSDDGVHFTAADSVINNEPGKKIDPTVKLFNVTLTKEIQARYVRVHAFSYGDMPAWSGVQGKAWIFASEIIVQ